MENFEELARETDTLTFTIVNEGKDPNPTISEEAIDMTGDNFRAWVAARLMVHWDKTGRGPKTVSIHVQVDVE